MAVRSACAHTPMMLPTLAVLSGFRPAHDGRRRTQHPRKARDRRVVSFVEGALDSPWGLLALAAVAAVDGFFPVVPSESLVVTAGVFAAAGDQSLALVIAAAALGAFIGDHVSYAVGS